MATSAQITSFINQLGKLAVAESRSRIAAGKGYVLPSVCIAQAALETGYGDSSLMTQANAYFGIKADGWNGKVYSSATNEVYSGNTVTITAAFRAYDSPADSVKDYYDLITGLSRYSGAVSRTGYVRTPEQTITAIKNGGYATDPQYISKVMSIINGYKLTEWDRQVTTGSTSNNNFSGYRDNIATIATGERGQAEPSGDDKYIKFYNSVAGVNWSVDSTPWCAIFVTWCARQAGIPETSIPNFAYCPYGIDWFKKAGTWKAAGSYTPQKGDLIFFDWEQNGICDHVGIITAIETNSGGSVIITTVEGNSSGAVNSRRYSPASSAIVGYGTYSDGFGDYNFWGNVGEHLNDLNANGTSVTGTLDYTEYQLQGLTILVPPSASEPLYKLVEL